VLSSLGSARDVAIGAVDAAHAVEPRARRAPDRRGGALRGGLLVVLWIDDRLAVLADDLAGFDLGLGHVTDEVRRDAARVHGESADAPPLGDRIERDGEQGIGRLRLAVCQPGVIGAALEVGIVEVDARAPVPVRAERDHAGTLGADEAGPEAAGELEVAEVVAGELGLVAAGIARERRRHHARVVDEDVEHVGRGEDASGEAIDRRGIEQVHGVENDVGQVAKSRLGLLRIAGGHEDLRARRVEGAHGLEADPGVAPGDDDALAPEVDAADHLLGRRGGAKAGTDRSLRCGHAWDLAWGGAIGSARPDGRVRPEPWSPST
jgi:hypothetical protein